MKIKITLLTVAALLLAGVGWFAYRTMSAAPNVSLATFSTPQSQDLQRVQVVSGETVVMIGDEAQRASHIVVQPVAAAMVQPEITAYATVVDLQPLFDLRNRHAAARADRESTRAHADASRLQYERTRILFQDDRNASQKSLQDAQAMMQADDAKLQAAEAMLGGLEAALRQQYGNVLAVAAVAPHSALSDRLLSGHAAIVRVTLPGGNPTPAPEQITMDGSDGQPSLAHKLSPSPLVDPAVQGSPYLYVVDSALPVGTRTLAHVPIREKNTAGTPGFRIPEAAIVWYGGQSWAYIKTDANHFTRRHLPLEPATQRELVVTSGFHAGDEVVISGAQLLLSEELRPQGIAAQQCKDPPECDD
jgi:multidrug efflux system membrane fusion protein